jgi:hypothetical protein
VCHIFKGSVSYLYIMFSPGSRHLDIQKSGICASCASEFRVFNPRSYSTRQENLECSLHGVNTVVRRARSAQSTELLRSSGEFRVLTPRSCSTLEESFNPRSYSTLQESSELLNTRNYSTRQESSECSLHGVITLIGRIQSAHSTELINSSGHRN